EAEEERLSRVVDPEGFQRADQGVHFSVSLGQAFRSVLVEWFPNNFINRTDLLRGLRMRFAIRFRIISLAAKIGFQPERRISRP
ncbi:hypothetical protein MK280_10705, partial [Myxococcota bacterium]|nr:hypothetical protein [Myxococcota bacterium]